MTLFLVSGRLEIHVYMMGQEPSKKAMRIVEADTEADAREKFEKALTRPDSYGTSKYAYAEEAHAVIT